MLIFRMTFYVEMGDYAHDGKYSVLSSFACFNGIAAALSVSFCSVLSNTCCYYPGIVLKTLLHCCSHF